MPGGEGGEARVLLADDERVSRFAARRFLEKAGFEVDEVTDGRAAVKGAATGRYLLILLDCQLPVVDGPEAARQIRAAEADRGGGATRVPIIALTAHESVDVHERCREAGMDACVTKPLEREMFDALVIRLLSAEARDSIKAGGVKRSATPEPAAAADAAPAETEAPGPVVLPVDPGAPFDVNAMLSRARNDAAFVAQLLERFHARAAERLEQLVRCVEAGSAHAVAEEVHGLLGAARHLSAKGLEGACQTMELAARAGDLRGAKGFIGDVRSELRRCMDYVPGVVEALRGRAA
jgi:CheY-like chemotaxis protein